MKVADRFSLEREIGSGGMARVFLGRDETLERLVAVKILGAEFNDSDVGSRFRREGRTAARLSHPNIVQVYDAGEEEFEGSWSSYIVMEYIPGGDLKGLLDERGRFPTVSFLRLARARPRAWRTRTSGGSFTATSSRTTYSSTSARAPSSRTSASPGRSTRPRATPPDRARISGRPCTPRPSSSGARRPRRKATFTRWVSRSTRRPPANLPSPAAPYPWRASTSTSSRPRRESGTPP